MKKNVQKLTLSRETLRGLTLSEVAGGATAGIECSGLYTSCRSQWPNCNFTATCPQFTADELACGPANQDPSWNWTVVCD